jgi:hypothetical protein
MGLGIVFGRVRTISVAASGYDFVLGERGWITSSKRTVPHRNCTALGWCSQIVDDGLSLAPTPRGPRRDAQYRSDRDAIERAIAQK